MSAFDPKDIAPDHEVDFVRAHHFTDDGSLTRPAPLATLASATTPQLTSKSSYLKKSWLGQPVPSRGKLETIMETDLPGILIVDDNEDNRYTLRLHLNPMAMSGSLTRRAAKRRSLYWKRENLISSCSI